MAEQTLDDITRKVWAYSNMVRTVTVSERDMPLLLAGAIDQVYETWKATHPEANREDVLASFARTRPTEAR